MPHSKFTEFMFFNIAWEGGALGSGERGTWERTDPFFKSSKDLLHYSVLLFRNVPSVFDLHYW